MSRYAGVLRDSGGLARLTKIIEGAAHRDGSQADAAATHDQTPAPDLTLAEVEAANLREVSALIATAALRRTESRGCHRRSDAPETQTDARHSLARLHAGQITITWEEM
jgi:L-aspartate oxidase